MNPNHRMSVPVDHVPKDDGALISIFESAAIMTYIAGKKRRFRPRVTGRRRPLALEEAATASRLDRMLVLFYDAHPKFCGVQR